MKQNDQELDNLIETSRKAPAEEPPAMPFGFAAKVSRQAYPGGLENASTAEDALMPALRWSFAACVAATLVIAAVSGRSVVLSAFTPGVAYESHVAELVLFGGE